MRDLGNVMVIDDEEIDQRQYKRLLVRSGRVRELFQFYYADEALDWLRAHPDQIIDVVFLDINMPRMNGFQFLDALSGEAIAENLRIILMLTTSLAPQDRARALEHPLVHGFLTKPFTLDHMDEASRLLHAA